MADAWIRRGKLAPPQPPAGKLTRGFAAEAAPVLLLVGGPGSGKTLALLEVVDAARAAGQPTVWFGGDERDTDAAGLFHHLIAGVEAHIPQFGDPVRALLGGDGADTRDPARLWLGFFEALAAFNLPAFTLAIDDFHHVQAAQPGLAEALASCFDKLPAGLRLLVATRRKPELPLARLRARGKVALLDAARLRFTFAETEAFLAARAGVGPVPAAWARAAAELDGWPLGLDLVAHGAGAAPLGEDALAAYAREELVDAQPADQRAFMLRAAILDEVSAEACARIFGTPDAADRLGRLEAEHLVQALAGGAGHRFPPWLRDVLRAEAARSVPPSELAGWHAGAARWHHEAGRPDAALPHAIAASDWDLAREACRPLFPAMRYDGRQAQVGKWLDAWPPAVAMRDPWLQLWRGHLSARAGESAQALAAYELARRLYEAAGDGAGAFAALVGQANTALTLNDDAAYARLGAEAEAHPGPRAAADEVDLWLIRAYDGERRGDMAAMRAGNQAALEVPVGADIEVAAGHAIALMNLATHALYQGDLAGARRGLARAAALVGAWPFYAYRLSVAFLQAHLDLLEGRDAALPADLPPAWREILDWHDLGVADTVIASWHQARGELDEAEAAAQRALGVFEKAGFREGRAVPLERLLWIQLGREKPARAIELAEAEARQQEPDAPRPIHDLALDLPHARALHLAGRPSLALALLDRAIPAFEALDARLHVAHAQLFRAAALAAVGEPAAARTALAEAQGRIDAGGWGFLREQDRRLWQELGGIAPPPADQVRLKRSGGKSVLAPARAGVLALRAFGRFEVRQDGVLLDAWPRRKAKLLLAALALHPDGLRAGELAELIGGEEANPLNVLRVNAWALRRALEPALGRGEDSAYVRREGDRYRLAWDRVEGFDLRDFAAALAQAAPQRERDPRAAIAALEAGLALVRGPLFDDGPPFDLFEADRERCRRQACEALAWIAAQHRQVGAYDRAEAALERAIALAPCDEAGYDALMRLRRARGDAAGVRRAYWDLRRALKSGLGLVPTPELDALYRKLTGDR